MRKNFLEAINQLEPKEREFFTDFLGFIERLGFSTSVLCSEQIDNWIDLIKPTRLRLSPKKRGL